MQAAKKEKGNHPVCLDSNCRKFMCRVFHRAQAEERYLGIGAGAKVSNVQPRSCKPTLSANMRLGNGGLEDIRRHTDAQGAESRTLKQP